MVLFTCFADRRLCFTVSVFAELQLMTIKTELIMWENVKPTACWFVPFIGQLISGSSFVWSGIRVCSTSNYQIICLSSCSCNRCYSDKRGLVSCDSWIWWPNDFPYNKIYNNENENWAAGEVNEKFKNCNKKKGRENLLTRTRNILLSVTAR